MDGEDGYILIATIFFIFIKIKNPTIHDRPHEQFRKPFFISGALLSPLWVYGAMKGI